MLQYADDIIFLKVILCYFEHLSRLKINFHKSEIYCFGEASQEIEALKYFHLCGMCFTYEIFRYSFFCEEVFLLVMLY